MREEGFQTAKRSLQVAQADLEAISASSGQLRKSAAPLTWRSPGASPSPSGVLPRGCQG